MRRRVAGLGRTSLYAANRLARPLDRLTAVRGRSSAAPLMIVGLPRSGTTLAYELLVQALDVAFLTRIYSYLYGMPNLVTRIIRNRIRSPRASYTSVYGRIPGRFAPAENAVFWDQWMPVAEDLGHYVPQQSISPRASADAEATLASMSAIAGRPYIFKNVYMTLSLPALFELVPDVRVVVVRRRIETNVASIYNRRKSLSSWWSIRPPFANEVEDRSVLVQTAFQCVRSEQILDDALRGLPSESLMLVHYESICEAPQDFVERVSAWAGADFAHRSRYRVPGAFVPSKGPDLPAIDAAELPAILRALDASASEYISRLHATTATIEPHGWN